MKFVEKIFDIFKDNEEEVVIRAKQTGVESFVKGNFEVARKSFNNAFIKSNIDSDTERNSKELLAITILMIEAEEDLHKEKWNIYINKMQKIYSECGNEEMKIVIGQNRNKQAQKFEEMAEKFQNEENLEEAKKFFQFAYKICTKENPKKEDLKKKIDDNDDNWEIL